MITGFNTDVEYDGVTYHVQTEDKGLDSPLILSLVYSGGAILASKRSPYHDLIAAGFSEQTLTERLQRQHKLICAAINAGRLDDLKKMSGRRATPSHSARPADNLSAPIPAQATVATEKQNAYEAALLTQAATESPLPAAQTLPDKISDAPVIPDSAQIEAIKPALHLGLLEERELRGGEFVTLRVRLSRGTTEARDAVADATITLKILGTTFRPVISSARTDQDGIAIVFAALPRFATGRAAILIRAVADGEETEMRRIVHPS
ncbi:MAG: hypothetical protein H0X14_12680 [Acidobacteria bacterium]|nr:hypothetical protein [Acidobacteriota bacterium]